MRLIDADALIETIRNFVDTMSVCTSMDYCNGLRSMKKQAIEAVENAPTVEPASPWHRVEDELPDDTRDVLAVRRYGNDLEKQEVIVAHLSVIMDMKRGFDKWWNATNITHWMPFPEPPKEEE